MTSSMIKLLFSSIESSLLHLVKCDGNVVTNVVNTEQRKTGGQGVVIILHQAQVPDHVVIRVADFLHHFGHQDAAGQHRAVRLTAARKV